MKDLTRSAAGLRVLQLVLVASLVASPALQIGSAILHLTPSIAGAFTWLLGAVLIAVFVARAHALACALGQAPATAAGGMMALTLIPCVSIVGIPYALWDLARSYAALTRDEGLVTRTTLAAVLYPVLSMGLGMVVVFASIALVSAELSPESSPVLFGAVTSLPTLLAQAALAAATYFLASAARDAADMQRDLAAAGGAAHPTAVAL